MQHSFPELFWWLRTTRRYARPSEPASVAPADLPSPGRSEFGRRCLVVGQPIDPFRVHQATANDPWSQRAGDLADSIISDLTKVRVRALRHDRRERAAGSPHPLRPGDHVITFEQPVLHVAPAERTAVRQQRRIPFPNEKGRDAAASPPRGERHPVRRRNRVGAGVSRPEPALYPQSPRGEHRVAQQAAEHARGRDCHRGRNQCASQRHNPEANSRRSLSPGATSDHCRNSSERRSRTLTISASDIDRGANALNSWTVHSVPMLRSQSKSPTICSTSPASTGRGPRAPLPVVSSRSHPSATSPKKPRRYPSEVSTAKCVRSCSAKCAPCFRCFCHVIEPSARRQVNT